MTLPVDPVTDRLEVITVDGPVSRLPDVRVVRHRDWAAIAAPATRRHAWLWERYARVYDALEGLTGYREMIDSVVTAVGSARGLRVVEIGCGTGNVLMRLLPHEPELLVGLDSSQAMVDRARRKMGAGIAAGLVSVERADAVQGLTAIGSATLDAVVASNVIYALPDRVAFWTQAARVLRPGGRVVVSNPDRAGFGPAVRQQWRTRGVAGFTDVRMLEVVALNVAIDMLAATHTFEFPQWSQLAAEASASGVGEALLHGRCYGGPFEGINVVGELRKT